VRQVLFKGLNASRVELGHISAHFEKQGVLAFKGPLYQLIVLLLLRNQLGVPGVGGQIHSERNQLLANHWLWAVND
jgi:hypothetical protein